MRNKAKNVRMNLEATLDVETLSYMKFSLTVHSKILKTYWKKKKREKFTVSCIKYIISWPLTLKSPPNIWKKDKPK